MRAALEGLGGELTFSPPSLPTLLGSPLARLCAHMGISFWGLRRTPEAGSALHRDHGWFWQPGGPSLTGGSAEEPGQKGLCAGEPGKGRGGCQVVTGHVSASPLCGSDGLSSQRPAVPLWGTPEAPLFPRGQRLERRKEAPRKSTCA